MVISRLTGLWVFIGDDAGYNSGQVESTFLPFCLVRMRPTNTKVPGPSVLRLFMVEDLTQGNQENLEVFIFESEPELDAWMAWLLADDDDEKQLKVVRIKPSTGE